MFSIKNIFIRLFLCSIKLNILNIIVGWGKKILEILYDTKLIVFDTVLL